MCWEGSPLHGLEWFSGGLQRGRPPRGLVTVKSPLRRLVTVKRPLIIVI